MLLRPLVSSVLFISLGWAQSAESERWSAVRHAAAALLNKVPNYICIETFDREQRASLASTIDSDRLRVEVAYVGNKEIYSWPGQKKFSNEKLSQIAGDGLTSTGLFANVPSNIFLRDAYHVRFAQEEEREGRRVFRYDFQSGPGQKYWQMGSGNRTGAAGERGSFWMDAENLILIAISVDATDLPPSLPYTQVHVVIEYSPAMIVDRHVLLPETATVDVTEVGGQILHDQLDFSHCRAFGAESQLTPAPETHSAPQWTWLPPGLTVRLKLDESVDIDHVYAGQPIQASTLESIRLKGRDPIPAGSPLHGFVRRVLHPRQGAYLISLEFDTVDTPLGPALFYGRLISIDKIKSVQPYLEKKALIPGVATFLATSPEIVVPKDTRMVWKIEEAALRERVDAPGPSPTRPPQRTNLPSLTVRLIHLSPNATSILMFFTAQS